MATEVETFEIRPEIIVQAFDVETTLEAFSLNDIEEFYIEHGGWADPLGQLASAIMGFIEDVANRVKGDLMGWLRDIYNTVSGIPSKISDIFSRLGGIRNIVDDILDKVRGLPSTVGEILGKVSGVRSIVDSILNIVKGLPSKVGEILGKIGVVSSTVKDIFNKIKDIPQKIADGFKNVLDSIRDIYDKVKEIPQKISQGFENVLKNIGIIVDKVKDLPQKIAEGFENIGKTLSDIFEKVKELPEKISQGFENVLKNLSEIVEKVKDLPQKITDGFKNVLDNMRAIFDKVKDLPQKISDGFRDVLKNLGEIVDKVKDLPQKIADGFSEIGRKMSEIFDKVKELPQKIAKGFEEASKTISGVIEEVKKIPEKISKGFEDIIEKLKALPELPQKVWQFIQQNIVQPLEEHVVKPIKAFFEDLWNEHIKPFFDKLKDIPSKMAEISKAFQGFINPLVGIAQFFDQIRQKFIDFVTNIPNYIKAIGDFFGDIAKDPLGWFKDNVVKPLADAFSAIGKWVWEHLPDWFKNAIMTIQDWFSDAKDWLAKGWKDFVDWVSKIPEHLKGIGDFFKPLTDKVKEFLEDPIGAINNAVKWVYDAFKSAVTWVWDGLKWVFRTIAKSVSEFFTDVIGTITQFLTDKLCNFAVGLTDYAWKLLMGIYNKVKGSFETVGKELSKLMTSLISSITSTWGEYLEKSMMPILEKIRTGKSRQFIEMVEMIGALMSGFVVGAYLLHGLRKVLYALAHWVYELEYRMATKTRLGWRLLIAPAGMGGSGRSGFGGDHILDLKISVGKTIGYLAKMLGMYPEKLAVSMAYGWGIWLSQPMAKIANASFRNLIPIELPTLAEMRDITRRHMPIPEKFNETLARMKHYLAMYGYNDEVIAWLTTPVTEKGWFITIKDRFAYDRNIPISLLYELPTPSDFCRMMIHDIIMHPDYFAKVMQMKGYNDDVAMMYYLLHFRYPTLEKLWEFYCRARADMLWLDKDALPEIVTKEEEDIIEKYGIGEIPIYPAELNVSRNPNAPQTIMNAIKLYAKWWDYAFFNWFKKEGIKFPSDRLIVLDLMAEIPQRIDARWMYKWSIIKDVDLMKIVTARGMHPKWVETITIAECMNALAEERTYARTGVINAFKEGFMPLDGLNKTLSYLTDVKILGKDVPVRFLDGEVKLLTLRAKYDRALDILRDYFKELLWSVSENIIPFDGMTKALKEEVTAVAKELELSNLALDESYFKLYKPVVDYYKKIRTIDRIRYWTRYMLYRLLQRFSEGFMSREEFEGMINDIVERGKLTEEEREYFKTIAQFMYDGFHKKALADGILKKLSRGAISEEEARKRLIELGLTKDIVDALIEKYAKTYTLSISTLLSYADEVYIPEELLLRKLEILGVPEDEKKIVLQVFRIRPIKDELAKAVRSEIDRFIEGYIDEATLRESLKKLGKMQKEIDLIVQYAKIEKSMEINKLRIDAILNRLRRGAISMEEAMEELRKYITDVEVINALIEKYVKTYQLSISTLLSYADEVMIPESLLEKKMELLGVPEDERNIIKQVFKIRPIKDERAKAIRAQIEKFIEGYIDENTLRQELLKLGKLKEEIDLIVQYAKVEKSMEINKLKIDAILNRLRRGAITIEEATKELSEYIVDKEVVNALIEKYVRTYTLSIATLISYAEYVDIPEDLLKKKLAILGVPEDEIPIILQVFRIRPLRDEYAKQISEALKQFEEGYIDEEKLKSTLKGLGKSDKEIQILVTFAKARRWRHKVEYFVDAILNQLRRGAITIDKAKEELSKYIVDESLIDAMIEKTVRVYTLSIPQLLSYAEYVDIPEEFVKKKLEILGVPQDEIPIILQVFKIRPLKDERAKMIRSVIDAYIDGYITKEQLQQNLKNLGKSPREVQILTEFADFEKSQATVKLAIDAILNRLRRGAITLEEAKKELSKYVVDKALIDAMIEKYVRTSVWTPDKLVSMGEYVPIDINKVVEKAKMFGYPEEEVKLYPAYLLARNLSEEIGRIVTELVYLYVYDIIDEETLRKEIDKVRTLNGEVKKFGVDWIVIDDMEKELIIQRAKLRKMREQGTS